MRHDLDTRARQAAAGLKSAVEQADLRSLVPGSPDPGRRRRTMLRPAWIAAVLLVGSAVAVAMVVDPAEPPATTITTATTVGSTATATGDGPTATTVPLVVAPSPTSTTLPAPSAPKLTITSPADGEILREKTVAFIGTTDPGVEVWAGRWQAEVDSEGNWSILLVLTEGPNRATFLARDDSGSETVASITVHFAPPATTTTTKPATTTTTKPVLAAFTAYSKFGSSSEDPPFDVYYGTGQPGSTVKVQSPHGSGSVTVGANGKWEVKVHFPSAPPGETFSVKVFDDHGRQETFDFVHTP